MLNERLGDFFWECPSNLHVPKTRTCRAGRAFCAQKFARDLYSGDQGLRREPALSDRVNKCQGPRTSQTRCKRASFGESQMPASSTHSQWKTRQGSSEKQRRTYLFLVRISQTSFLFPLKFFARQPICETGGFTFIKVRPAKSPSQSFEACSNDPKIPTTASCVFSLRSVIAFCEVQTWQKQSSAFLVAGWQIFLGLVRTKGVSFLFLAACLDSWTGKDSQQVWYKGMFSGLLPSEEILILLPREPALVRHSAEASKPKSGIPATKKVVSSFFVASFVGTSAQRPGTSPNAMAFAGKEEPLALKPPLLSTLNSGCLHFSPFFGPSSVAANCATLPLSCSPSPLPLPCPHFRVRSVQGKLPTSGAGAGAPEFSEKPSASGGPPGGFVDIDEALLMDAELEAPYLP